MDTGKSHLRVRIWWQSWRRAAILSFDGLHYCYLWLDVNIYFLAHCSLNTSKFSVIDLDRLILVNTYLSQINFKLTILIFSLFLFFSPSRLFLLLFFLSIFRVNSIDSWVCQLQYMVKLLLFPIPDWSTMRILRSCCSVLETLKIWHEIS